MKPESQPIVCVDIDGVLCRMDSYESYFKFGPLIPGALEFMQELRRRSYHIIIHTSRCTPSCQLEADGITYTHGGTLYNAVWSWLWDNKIPFDEIWYKPGKPTAHAYVDDRAVACNPTAFSSEFSLALEQIADFDKIPTSRHA